MTILRKIWRALADNLAHYFAPCALVAVGVAASSCEDADAPARRRNALRAPLGLASCWNDGGRERVMNVLSPRMSDAVFRERLAWMLARGCTHAHLLLANGGDGEAAGYKAWDTADSGKMMRRWMALKAAGLTPIPWVIADDSKALASDLFSNAETRVKAIAKAGFFDGVPLVVIGLEMDEYGSDNDWGKLREAIRKHYAGPLGVHHTSGSGFKYAKYGDVICGQLAPGCSESQIKAQIARIRALGKRAIGFEYARGANRKLAQAALAAGAEGVGNW